jgi:predicted 2-oxoglutarate/Fe(II)-dependent dioxygenase YbiX
MPQIDDEKPYILQIENVLSAEKCTELIERIETLKPSTAPVNTIQGTRVRTDIRNNERVMFNDQHFAQEVYEKAADKAPHEMHGYSLVGANERIRCYRYKAGMRFAPHADGAFVRNPNEMSFYSYLIYLSEGFEGGETTFFTEPEVAIEPKLGWGLLFQHPLIHEGSEVKSGVKYVARTDLMYRK